MSWVCARVNASGISHNLLHVVSLWNTKFGEWSPFFFFFLLAPLKSTRGRHRPRLISMKLNQTELLLQPAATIQRSTLIAPPDFTLNWTNWCFFLSLCGVFNRENLSERAFLFLFFFSFTGDSTDLFSPPHTGFQDETIWWVSAITLEYFASQISTALRVLGSLSGAARGVVLQYKPRPSGPTSSLKLTLVSHTNKPHQELHVFVECKLFCFSRIIHVLSYGWY